MSTLQNAAAESTAFHDHRNDNAAATAFHAYDLLTSTSLASLNDADRQVLNEFDTWLRSSLAVHAPRAVELRERGKLTPAGISDELRPEFEARLKSFEEMTSFRLAQLEAARARIENGEVIRAANGTFDTVPNPEPTAVSEVRAGEIRSYARTLSQEDRRRLIRDAFETNDIETLRALRHAPRAMDLWPDSMQRELASRRLAASGWEPHYQEQVSVLALRQYVLEKARGVVETIGELDPRTAFKKAKLGGQITISPTAAKDPAAYRAAKARAEKIGAELVIAE